MNELEKAKGDLISREALKEDLFIKFGNQLPNGLFDEINNAPTISPYKAIYDELHKGEEE